MRLTRRSLLTLPRITRAAALQVPVIDRLSLTVVVDGTANAFMQPLDRPDLKVVPAPRIADYHRTYAAQWAYALYARSAVGTVERATMIDFGYTPEALLGNMALLGLSPDSVAAMVLSHGHYDHFGGLDGFLATGRVRRGTPLFVGGEEAFCERVRGTSPDSPSFGAIDRPALNRAGVDLVISSEPKIVAGHGFITGAIPFVSPERPRVPTGMLPGKGCARDLLDPAKRNSAFLVDDAVHEIGTAFHVAGRGLVVIGSCSHRGIINTVRQAQAVSGVAKVHAIVGGFHLVAPQTREQAFETVALMQAIAPDYIIPGHCSGETFIGAALAAMPDKVIRSIVGTRFEFGRA